MVEFNVIKHKRQIVERVRAVCVLWGKKKIEWALENDDEARAIAQNGVCGLGFSLGFSLGFMV